MKRHLVTSVPFLGPRPLVQQECLLANNITEPLIYYVTFTAKLWKNECNQSMVDKVVIPRFFTSFPAETINRSIMEALIQLGYESPTRLHLNAFLEI